MHWCTCISNSVVNIAYPLWRSWLDNVWITSSCNNVPTCLKHKYEEAGNIGGNVIQRTNIMPPIPPVMLKVSKGKKERKKERGGVPQDPSLIRPCMIQ